VCFSVLLVSVVFLFVGDALGLANPLLNLLEALGRQQIMRHIKYNVLHLLLRHSDIVRFLSTKQPHDFQ
jgi:hypothetical protein